MNKKINTFDDATPYTVVVVSGEDPAATRNKIPPTTTTTTTLTNQSKWSTVPLRDR